MAAPLRYDPSDEQPAPDEAHTFDGLNQALHSILETTSKDYGHAVRSVHAKSHGLIEGEMTVLADLPPDLAQGVFAKPGRYPVVMRFSTNPGDLLDDSVSTPRGLAVKIIGVAGERLPGSEGATTQDFVMANAPAFAAADPKSFLGNLTLLAKTTDAPQVLKKAASLVLRGAEAVVEATGRKSALLVNLGGQAPTHVLGETYYSQVPLRYGPYVAKLSVAPASPGLQALEGVTLRVAGHPNALRDAVNDFFKAESGVWEVRVQLRTDAETMPIEDASVAWPEDASPYVTVARITAMPQTGWSEQRAYVGDDALSFSPWHGIADHQPLGGIMRARKRTYEASAQFRSEFNRCPIHQPSQAPVLPEV